MIFSFRYIAFVSAVAVFCGCSVRTVTMANDPNGQISDRSKSLLCVPLDTLHVTYVDNTKAAPDTLFNDSFFLEAANSLLLYEASKNFNVRQWTPGASFGADSCADLRTVLRRGGFSPLARDTASLARAAGCVKDFAKKYNADLVAIPYACVIRNLTVRPTGWRNGKYDGPGYERPIAYTAKTEFHVQIWDKNGALLFERIGKSDTGRPVFYSLLKKEKHPDKDIVKYAKRMYAPPLVKSLYNSIKASLQVRS